MTTVVGTPVSKSVVTMSSREVAELTGKRHTDVKRDIEVMMAQLNEDVSKFAHTYLDSMNRTQTEYLLDRDHVVVAVMAVVTLTTLSDMGRAAWQPRRMTYSHSLCAVTVTMNYMPTSARGKRNTVAR